MITEEFINSVEYTKIMFEGLDEDTDLFNLARSSKNFWRRANLKELGAWRWMSAYQYRSLIADYVFSDMKGIDFGGQCGPIGGNAMIVDIANKECDSLTLIKSECLDYIFSSHTLEHITGLHITLLNMYDRLKDNGKLILILPSHTCTRWNVGINTASTHVWNMYLSRDKNAKYYNEFDNFLNIDTYLRVSGFKILKAEYCWDNSIFILAEKGERFWADWMTLGLR